MATPTNKSSSLSKSNPNSRSSEIGNPIRKSFSGNPFAKPSLIASPRTFLPNTSANSPSDFPRRKSSGGNREGAGSFRDLDDKENGKDQNLKPAKIRSPAASTKGAKNFMSPTISASSKITVSPRKKVLTERNEPARTSVSSSTDGKTPIRKVTFAEPLELGDLKPDGGLELEEKKLEALLNGVSPKEEMHSASLTCEDLSGEAEAVHDENVPLNPKNDTESSFGTVSEEHDCVNLDPSFKLSLTPPPSPPPPPVSSTSAILAPLDADPLMPPYDPQTNYLSPRPQFLHYKPKPRIALCQERELENSLVSGSFSDSEVTEDAQSEGTQKESEDVSSDETVEEEAGRISEPSPGRTFMPEEETVEAKEVPKPKPKPRFFNRSKAFALLLLLCSVAFISISVTSPPVIHHSVFENLYEFYESSEFSGFAEANFDRLSEFARANFEGLARNFHTWFTKSLSSISELISNFRGVHKLGQLQYCNLTVLYEYNAADQGPIFGRGDMDIGETPVAVPQVLTVEESDSASEIDTDEDIRDISAEHYDSVYEEHVQKGMGEVTEVENASDVPESEEVLGSQPATLIESEQALQLAEVSEPHHSEIEIDLKDQPGLNSETAEIHTEEFEAGNLEANNAQENYADFNADKNSNVGPKDQPDLESEVAEIHAEVHDDNEIMLSEAEGKSISVDAATSENEGRVEEAIDIPPRMVLYLLFCGGTVLIAGAAFNWSRKGKSRSTRVASVEQPLSAEAFHASSSTTPKEEETCLDKPSLRNVPTETDVVGESCPSEMSSFQKSSSYSKKVLKEFNEVHSLEKKHRKGRESLASSSDYSMGSPSYGSFTTYEKISIKHGNGDDEETFTPVRRSSRIRSQATSPL